MCISYICNRSSSDFGNFFASYFDYRACTLLIDLLRRTTIARQLGSHSITSSRGGQLTPPSRNRVRVTRPKALDGFKAPQGILNKHSRELIL